MKRTTTNTALGFAINSSQPIAKKSALRAARPSLTLFFAIGCFLCAPYLALAQVKITEILYDAPGADTGREWVEVANFGSQNVDIGKYKLLESGTNHGLKLVQSSSVLAPNSAAIIAADPAKFLADYPAFSGALFDSAFSLSNTGESLTLKDASSSVLDTVAYTSTSETNGTGGSLNLKEGNFVAAMASPGVYPGPMTPVPKPAPVPGKTVVKKTTAVPSSAGAALSNLPQESNAASLSLLPELSQPVLIGLGLLATVLLGAAGVFFIRQGREETLSEADEFNIE